MTNQPTPTAPVTPQLKETLTRISDEGHGRWHDEVLPNGGGDSWACVPIGRVLEVVAEREAAAPAAPEALRAAGDALLSILTVCGLRGQDPTNPGLAFQMIRDFARPAYEAALAAAPPTPDAGLTAEIDVDAIEHRLHEEALRHDGRTYFYDVRAVNRILDAARLSQPKEPSDDR